MGGAKLLLALASIVTALGVAACDDDDDDGGGTTTSAKEGGEPILIKTHVDAQNPEQPTTGDVLPASSIGDSTFCDGGTFRDAPVAAAGEDIVRLFRCPGGTLTISLSPTGSGRTASGDWTVERGSGSFEGFSGGGQMKVVFESGPHPEGRERFTGNVSG